MRVGLYRSIYYQIKLNVARFLLRTYKMKIGEDEQFKKIQVLDPQNNVWTVIEKITKNAQQEDAFYVCDLSDVFLKYETWKQLLPKVEPYYAVKCNPTPVILELLAQLGLGFDCASREEIKSVLALNVDPSRIIFANPAKLYSHLEFASAVGVTKMTFDNEAELYKIKNLHPQAELMLRIKYDDPNAMYHLGRKFGCDPFSKEPAELLKLAKTLEIKVIGVCFHVGSSSDNPQIFKGAIKAASKVFKVASSLGFDFSLLDIGGGFLGEHGTSLVETARVINKALDDHFPDPSIKVVSEPGRFFVSSAFTLATNIHSMRLLQNDNKKCFMYYINAGIYCTFLGKFCNEIYHPQLLKQRDTDEKYLSTIWGPTCDSTDMVASDVLLPEMKIGDWIIFEDAGAYTMSLETKFNGFLPPKSHFVVNQSTWEVINKTTLFPEGRFVIGNLIDDLSSDLKGLI